MMRLCLPKKERCGQYSIRQINNQYGKRLQLLTKIVHALDQKPGQKLRLRLQRARLTCWKWPVGADFPCITSCSSCCTFCIMTPAMIYGRIARYFLSNTGATTKACCVIRVAKPPGSSLSVRQSKNLYADHGHSYFGEPARCIKQTINYLATAIFCGVRLI